MHVDIGLRRFQRELDDFLTDLKTETIDRYQKKLKRLLRDCKNRVERSNTESQWFLNLSSKSFNTDEISILCRNLKFAPAARKIPKDGVYC